MIKGQVYLITDKTNNMKYVGQTKTQRKKKDKMIPWDYKERFDEHKRHAKEGKRKYHLYNAMRAHGIDNFEIKLLTECETEVLDDVETKLIEQYKTLTPSGYNLETGGNKQKNLSEETKGKISKYMTEFYKTDEGKQFMQNHCSDKLKKFNLKNNDSKKIAKFKAKNIDRILISHSENEQSVYVYLYIENKRNKMRFHYTELNNEFINRIKTTVKEITNDMKIVTVSDDLKALIVL